MRTPRPQPGHPQAEQADGEDTGTNDETHRTEDAKLEHRQKQTKQKRGKAPGKGQEEEGDRNTSKCKAGQA